MNKRNNQPTLPGMAARQPGHSNSPAGEHQPPTYADRISFPMAMGYAALQMGVGDIVDAICHVATDYGHGVCLYREVFAAMSEACQVPSWPSLPYTYKAGATTVRGGLLCPTPEEGFGSPSGHAGFGSAECAILVSVETRTRMQNPLTLLPSDLTSGRVWHPGEHPLLIVVRRPDYEVLYRDILVPQRVRPVFKRGRLEVEGIDPSYDPHADIGLRLEDLLAR